MVSHIAIILESPGSEQIMQHVQISQGWCQWYIRPSLQMHADTDTLWIQYNTGIRIQYVSPFRGVTATTMVMAMFNRSGYAMDTVRYGNTY